MQTYQHDIEMLREIYGPLSDEELIKLHPDKKKEHIALLKKELKKEKE